MPRSYRSALVSLALLAACGNDPGTGSAPPLKIVTVVPANGATGVAADTKLSVTFDADVDPAALADRFTVSGVAGTTSFAAATHTATFTPDAPLPVNQTFTATVAGSLTSTAGGALGQDFVWSFDTRDTTPPTVVSTNPGDGASNVSTSKAIEVQFSEAMDPESFTASTFVVQDGPAAAPPIAGSLSYEPSTFAVTFLPADAYVSSTTYRVRLTPGIKDAAGNALASELAFSFTIGVDKVPPKVVAVLPLASATDVDLASAVSATFDEPLDPATVNATNFRLSPSAGGTVTWDGSKRRAVLTPTSLAQNTTYYASVSSVKDAAGNMLASTYSWSFKTARDTTPPTIVSTTPADLATNIPQTSRTFTVTFSEAVTGLAGITAKRNGTSVTVSTTYNAATRTATGTLADNPLPPGATYVVTVDVSDLNGNRIAGPPAFSFKVEPDSVPPTVKSITPANGARLVALNAAVTVVFSEDLDASTVTAANLSIAGVPAALAFASTTRTATLTPSAALSPGTDYTVTVGTGIKDLSGNGLAAPVVAKFRTVSAPKVISVDTAPGHTEPMLAFNAAGDGIAAWLVRTGADNYDLIAGYALFTAATGTWSAPATIPSVSRINAVAAATGRFALSAQPSASATVKNTVWLIEPGKAPVGASPFTGSANGDVFVAGTGSQIVAWSTSNQALVYSNGAWGNAFALPYWVRTSLSGPAGVAFALVGYQASGSVAVQPAANVVWTGSTWVSSGTLFSAQQSSQVNPRIAASATGFAFSWAWNVTSGSSYGTTYDTLLTFTGSSFSTQTNWSYQAGGGEVLLASDGAGFMAAWSECPGVPNCTPQIRWRRYSAGAWSAANVYATVSTGIDPAGLAGTSTGYVLGVSRGSVTSSATFTSATGTFAAEQPLLSGSAQGFQLLGQGPTVAAVWATSATLSQWDLDDVNVTTLGATGWAAPTKVYAKPDRLSGYDVRPNGAGGGVTFAASVNGEIVARTVASSVSAPTTLSDGVAAVGDATAPRLACLDDGTAFLAWLQYDHGRLGAWGARWANKSWSPPVQLAADATDVAVATDGSSVLVVMGGTGTITARTVKGGTVSAASTLDIDAMMDVQVAAAVGGGYVAGWYKRTGSNWTTYSSAAATSADGVTWSAATVLDTPSASGPIEVGAHAGTYALSSGYSTAPAVFVYSGGAWSAKSTVGTRTYSRVFVDVGSELQLLANYDGQTVVPLSWRYAAGAWTSTAFPVTGGGSGAGGIHAARNGAGAGAVAYVPHYVQSYGTKMDAFTWSGTAWAQVPSSVAIDSTSDIACDGTVCLALRSSGYSEAASILDAATPPTTIPVPSGTGYYWNPSFHGGGGNIGLAFESRASSGQPQRIWAFTEL